MVIKKIKIYLPLTSKYWSQNLKPSLSESKAYLPHTHATLPHLHSRGDVAFASVGLSSTRMISTTLPFSKRALFPYHQEGFFGPDSCLSCQTFGIVRNSLHLSKGDGEWSAVPPNDILQQSQVAQDNDLGNDICGFPKVVAPPNI